jgi:hypothetical protein
MIIRKSRPFSREEFSRRRPVIVDEGELFIASAEDVILAKLEWAKLGKSHRQVEDCARILQVQWQSLDRQYLNRWVAQLALGTEWSEAFQMAEISGLSISHE